MPVPVLTALVAVLLVAAAAAQPVAARLHLPRAVILAGGGLIASALAHGVIAIAARVSLPQAFPDSAQALLDLPISPDIFLFLLLPILLYQGAFGLDIRHLLQDGAAIVLLAVGAVVLSVLAIGIAVFDATGASFTLCLLIGAITATTDPSAVISLFRELGVPARVTRLVEGESLLNDATAIAIFTALMAAITTGSEMSAAGLAAGITVSLLSGAALGAAAGIGFAILLGQLSSWRSAQMTLTIALPYLLFSAGATSPHVSGVVAVVCGGIAVGAIGRARLSRDAFRFLGELLEQTADWATGLIFLLAALIIPRLLGAFGWTDLIAIGAVIAGAILARAATLWLAVPLLSRLRLMAPIEPATSVALLWGGLRGALTLALALAVAQDPDLPAGARRFVAVVATGYTLFTLFIQAPTLRPLIRRLGLDRLSGLDRALRRQALGDALARTRENVESFARRVGLGNDLVEEAVQPFEVRLGAAGADDEKEEVSDKEKIRLGLRALVNRERDLLLEQRWSPGLPPRLRSLYLFTLDRMRDETRARGRTGYLAGGRAPFEETPGLRLAGFLHRRFRLQAPLATMLSRQFHQMLVTRLLILQLKHFLDQRLRPVFGARITDILAEILDRRLEDLERHIDAVDLQYPGFARRLRLAMIERFAHREEVAQIRHLADVGIITDDIARSLLCEAESVHSEMRRVGRVDLAPPRPDLLRGLRAFGGFSDAQLEAAARRLRPAVFVADSVIYRPGDRVTSIYFIASGAVEIRRAGADPVRLGRGEAFGQLRIFNPSLAPAEVRAMSLTHMYRMSVHDFREFLRHSPAWQGGMNSPRAGEMHGE